MYPTRTPPVGLSRCPLSCCPKLSSGLRLKVPTDDGDALPPSTPSTSAAASAWASASATLQVRCKNAGGAHWRRGRPVPAPAASSGPGSGGGTDGFRHGFRAWEGEARDFLLRGSPPCSPRRRREDGARPDGVAPPGDRLASGGRRRVGAAPWRARNGGLGSCGLGVGPASDRSEPSSRPGASRSWLAWRGGGSRRRGPDSRSHGE